MPARLQHLPGLTGLRALAVAAVIAYHLGHLRGGFIGVDLFFVLSGFLITSLLLADTPQGASSLLRWWARRARRLVPAVTVVVLVVVVVFSADSGIALDGLATLTWWQNWHLVAEGSSYWEPVASPLRHAWSLSIEEQFYVLWPVLVAVAAILARRRGRRVAPLVAVLSFAGAAASFLWSARLAGDEDGLTRIYYGTDTRAGALLLGCGVAAVLHGRLPRRSSRAATTATLTALAGGVVLAVTIDPQEAWTYRGGLALAAVAAVVLVVGACVPGPVATALSRAPLQWLGVRSYALYLWSWPTQLWLESRTSLGTAAVAATTVVVSLALASVSLVLVERPLRFGSAWATDLRARRAGWSAGLGTTAIALLVVAATAAPTVHEQLAVEFERLPDPTTSAPPPPPPSTQPPAPSTTTCTPRSAPVPNWGREDGEFDPATVQDAADPTGDCDGVRKVLVLGDSTGRGAANGLRRAAPADLEIWDRTELGCGLVHEVTPCPDWQHTWRAALDEVRPDVVLVYLGVSSDLLAGDDPPFLSAQATEVRRTEVGRAIRMATDRGARVLWALPAVPLQRGVFFCDGHATDSPCDPEWISRWHADVRAIAAANGASTVDVRDWVARRGGDPMRDRPDGLHLSGSALDAHAAWLADQLRAVT